MIELGLERMSKLVSPSQFNWKAIHVAGTNGKGSVCAYLSAMLRAASIPHGCFTSPHLIDRWDCISVNGETMTQAGFRSVERQVRREDHEGHFKSTEFELLTATAFGIFQKMGVKRAIVEVGLGGKLDATNILTQKLATVITKIGYDHQAFLGSTLQDITRQKAGIMRHGIPCIVDGTNDPEVIDTLKVCAQSVDTNLEIAFPEDLLSLGLGDEAESHIARLEVHQQANLACALKTLFLSYKDPNFKNKKVTQQLIEAAMNAEWPGRLQQLYLSPLIPRKRKVLLDGAHNAQSAEVLRSYVDQKLRNKNQPVTWVLAASQGKNMKVIFGSLIRDGDNVVTVRFGVVDGMPWVRAAYFSEIRSALEDKKSVNFFDSGTDVVSGLSWAAKAAEEGPLVIAGSLYLVSDVLRLLRGKEKEG